MYFFSRSFNKLILFLKAEELSQHIYNTMAEIKLQCLIRMNREEINASYDSIATTAGQNRANALNLSFALNLNFNNNLELTEF
jgi:hypothetical protein